MKNKIHKVKHLPLKRIFDLSFSLACLILGAPIFLAIFILILFSSPGFPIYAHERVGRGGRLFRCYKFRTMYLDAEERLEKILQDNPQMRQEWETNFKLKNDPRITPVGSFLRRTSLDELPQFWNVLKGDLSIVGPRPVVMEELHKYFADKAPKVLSVRPGLTGLWQVSGRSDIENYQQRIALDEKYVDQRNFWYDLKLIAKTIPAMILSKGAY